MKIKLFTLAILALSFNAFTQNNNSGFLKGLVSYPGDGIPTEYVIKAVNINTGKVFSTKTFDVKTMIYTLKADAGEYYVFASTDPADPDFVFKAYYSEWVKCGETAKCLSHKILILKVLPNQTLNNINLTDCYYEDWTKEEKDLSNRSSSNEKSSSASTLTQVACETVKIGTQIWCKKNLSVSNYSNGDVIPQVQDAAVWSNLTTGAWCYYENNTLNGTKYGKLYNWYAVNDPRGLAPKGFHIASRSEWETLKNTLGEDPGTKMRSKSGWNENGNGTNEVGFTALPGGECQGPFYYIGEEARWWSTTEKEEDNTKAWLITIRSGYNPLNIYTSYKDSGESVRCLKD
jgi:uncharacterized protein (TIGR02145 family)